MSRPNLDRKHSHSRSSSVNLTPTERLQLITTAKTSNKSLHECAHTGDVEGIRYLLHVDQRDADERTALYSACSNGQMETARLLLDLKASVHSRNKDGYTPLHRATTGPIAELLIDRKADMHAGTARGTAGWQPLHVASTNGRLEVVKALLEAKASVTATTDAGEPLHFACSGGHYEVVTALLEAKANVNAQDDDGNTPLHDVLEISAHISEDSKKGITKALILAGAKYDIANADGESPLDVEPTLAQWLVAWRVVPPPEGESFTVAVPDTRPEVIEPEEPQPTPTSDSAGSTVGSAPPEAAGSAPAEAAGAAPVEATEATSEGKAS